MLPVVSITWNLDKTSFGVSDGFTTIKAHMPKEQTQHLTPCAGQQERHMLALVKEYEFQIEKVYDEKKGTLCGQYAVLSITALKEHHLND